MADFSSEGLTDLQVEQSNLNTKYSHQSNAYVIAVELSDWTYPNVITEPSIKDTTLIQSHVQAEIKPEPDDQPKIQPQKSAYKPIQATTQKSAQPTKRNSRNLHHQKGTGSGNRHATGNGSGKNTRDGPAGFANGQSDQTILRNIHRCYPLISRQRGEQGLAIVRIYVDADGNSTNTEIIQSTNFSRLDKCAIESVQSLKMKSKVINGKKVPGHFDQHIRFRLN